MPYRVIKWLILIIPTVTIGLWEYIRHEYLLPYVSMELGNVLAPIIVFAVTILFLTQLFDILERNQKELEEARATKAVLQEREKIARELHDGIAQSLFLLNVQVDRIEQTHDIDKEQFHKLRQNVHQAHTYVRQAIANLREPVEPATVPWLQSVDSLVEEMKLESELEVMVDWHIPEHMLTTKEKIELLAIMRESLMNVFKHAEAERVKIHGECTADGGWRCVIADDGIGLADGISSAVAAGARSAGHYGLRMMEDRAARMQWQFSIRREGAETVVMVQKGGIG